MRVAELTNLKEIRMTDRPIPEPGEGEVLLKVAVVGVCGSDVHYWEDGRIGHQVVQFPTVLGHEPSAIVEKGGPKTKLAKGTRVAVEPANSCGHCRFCLAGRPNTCPSVKFLGTPPIEGIFMQYRVMPEHCCLPIPDSMTLTEAALLEPFAVGLHSVKLARLELGEYVAVIGCGPIGISTAMSAKLAGASKILMTDPVASRRAFAEKFIGAETFEPGEKGSYEWIKEKTNGLGADVTFECVGTQEAVIDTCFSTRVAGRVVLSGIPSIDYLQIPMHDCRKKELVMYHVRRSNGEIEGALRLFAEGKLDIKAMATHHFSLEETAKAVEMVSQKADGVIRAMIHPNEDLS